jgi:hypothetical protein
MSSILLKKKRHTTCIALIEYSWNDVDQEEGCVVHNDLTSDIIFLI